MLPDLKLNWYDWWLSSSVQAVATKHNLKPSHANWLEAFPFTIVAETPDGVSAEASGVQPRSPFQVKKQKRAGYNRYSNL
jgi:hypothetical protein